MAITAVAALDTCQYADICTDKKCGSNEDPGKFDRVETGLKCSNYGVIVLFETVLEAADKKGEGQHRSGLDSAERLDDTHRKYIGSDKGKQALKRYEQSDKGKQAHKRHEDTDKGKLTKKLYYESDKGKAAHKAASERRKLVTRISKWVEENPGKTSKDYFELFPEELKIMED